jgi:CHASE3 domain sensor protein
MSATPPPHNDSSADPSLRRSTALLPLGTLLGLLVAGIAAVLIALVSLQSSESRTVTVRQFTATLELVQQVQQVLSVLKDAETGQRGFLLTGEASYLAPYREARNAFDSQLQTLRGLVGAGSAQTRRVDQLAEIANEKFAELDQTIALKREGKATRRSPSCAPTGARS